MVYHSAMQLYIYEGEEVVARVPVEFANVS